MVVLFRYKDGDQLFKSFYSGNDHLHQLTSLGTSDLYVRLEKFTGGWAYARYNNFTVADESYGYRMRLKARSYQGNAGFYQQLFILIDIYMREYLRFDFFFYDNKFIILLG